MEEDVELILVSQHKSLMYMASVKIAQNTRRVKLLVMERCAAQIDV